MNDELIIDLGPDETLQPYLLELPSELNYGSPNFESGKTKISLGLRPVARNLKKLYSYKKEPLPAELEVLNYYDIWLLTYSVGVLSEGRGLKKITQLQFEVEYMDEDQPIPNVTIIDTLPQSKFTRVVDGRFVVDATIDLTGKAGIGTEVLIPVHSETLGGNGKLNIDATITSGVNMSFGVLSADITAIGLGNYVGLWNLQRSADRPLLGDQLFVHTILVHQDTPYVDLRIRVSTVSTAPFGLLPVRKESGWNELRVSLV